MSEQIEDPTDATFGRTVNATLMAASVIGRRLAEELREQAAQRERAEQVEAARLAQRYEAQRTTARAVVESADERWMRSASPEDAAQAYATARAWSEVDPSFDAHAARIGRGIEDRWGVDVTAGGDEAALRREADVERSKARAENRSALTDEVTAGAVVAGTIDEVEALDRESVHLSEGERHTAAAADSQAEAAGYDTDARRRQLVDRAKEGGADAPTAEGRARAANANAKPLKDATRQGRGEKKARRRAAQSQRTRSDQLSR